MRWLKAPALAAGLAALCLFVAACGSDSGSDDGGNGSEEQVRVGVVLPSLSNDYFVSMDRGIREAVRRLGNVKVEYAFGSAAFPDGAQQVRGIEALTTKQVDAIVIADAFNTTKPALTRALAQGTPVVFMDYDGSEIPSSRTTLVATDNAAAGRKAGEYIAQALGNRGSVALLDGFPTVPVNYGRTEEARKALEAAGVDVVARLTTSCLLARGVSATENILTAHPDVDLIYSGCGDPILGAATAVARAGKAGQVKLVGYDALPDEIANIKAGKELASVAQFPVQMGYVAIQKAVEAARTGEVPADVVTDTAIVTRANADTALSRQIPAE